MTDRKNPDRFRLLLSSMIAAFLTVRKKGRFFCHTKFFLQQAENSFSGAVKINSLQILINRIGSFFWTILRIHAQRMKKRPQTPGEVSVMTTYRSLKKRMIGPFILTSMRAKKFGPPEVEIYLVPE